MRERFHTRHSLAIGLGLLLAGLAAIVALPSAAGEFDDESARILYRRATFVLRSGETIADVPFVVDEEFHIVGLEVDGARRKVSFSDISGVFAGQEDITAVIVGRPALAGRVPAPPATAAPDSGVSPLPAGDSGVPEVAAPAEQWLSKNDPVYLERSAPLWNLGLRVAGHYSNPVGDNYEGIGSGFGLEGDVLIGLKRTISLRVSVARTGLGTDDLSLAAYPPVEPTSGEEWNMEVWRFSMAAQIQKPLTERKNELGMLYLYTGLGAVWQELSVEFVMGGIPRRIEYDETKFLATLGGGVVKMLTRTVGLDISGEMGLVFVGSDPNTSYSYYGNTQTAMLLDLKLGIVKLFR